MEDKRICRLCLKIICGNDFDPLEQVTIYVLDMLRVKPKMGEYIEYVVCTVCSKSLKEAFGFKMACLKIEKKISAFVDSNETVKINLKVLNAKEEPNNVANEIVDNQKICRFCLNLISIDCCTYLNESKKYISIVDTLQSHIPELNLSITEELVACETCLDSLKKFHNFIKICLGSIKDLDKELDDKNQIKDEILCSSVVEKEEVLTIESEIKCEDAVKMEYLDVDIKNEENADQIDQACNSFVTLKPQANASDAKGCELQLGKGFTSHKLNHENPSDIAMYKCGICMYDSKYLSALSRHAKIHKNPENIKMYKCAVCTYETWYTHNLKAHALLHKGPLKIKWFNCELCTYKTKLRFNLKIHNWRRHKDHLKGKIYKCDVCPYQTTLKADLNKHANIHKEVRYKCEICSLVTKYKTHHMLIHKGHAT